MDLQISNVINISVSQAGTGVGEYNTSNVGMFTRETPGPNFGLLGYKIYLDPSEVGVDFGTTSNTFKMANAIFSQQPNILANNGYLVIMPFLSLETLDAAITRTVTLVQYFAVIAVEIESQTDTLAAAAVIQPLNKIWMVPSQTAADVAPGGLIDLLRSGGFSQSRGLFYGSQAIIAVQTITFSTAPASGAWTLNYGANPTGSLAFNANAAAIQTALRLLPGLATVTVTGDYTAGFVVTFVGVDGPATLLTINPNTLLNSVPAPVVVTVLNTTVGKSVAQATTECLIMAASYTGRAFSTNFDGSNTTQNMHLKDLIGVQPDPSMSQTLLNQCQLAGADAYVSIQGVAKVFASGANTFFDRVYNLRWIVGAIQVAGFNVLAQTNTKIPQTEDGVSTLKNAFRQVCEQGVTNQYLAPGRWTSPNTFGNQGDFFANIGQRGYYLYSIPVSQQNPTDRAARLAPLIQIAIKEAGAIDKADVIINVNA